jgi:hypothetical protein
MTELRVLARAYTLVLDVAFAARTGRLRFVGRQLTEYCKLSDVPEGVPTRERDPVMPGDKYYVEGWAAKLEPTVVPATGEFGTYFVQMIQEGGLTPADKSTADYCGVAFVGGE